MARYIHIEKGQAMDFGHILDDWERLSAKPGGLDKAAEAERALKEVERKRRLAAEAEGNRLSAKALSSLASWLDTYGVEDKDADCVAEGKDEAGLRRDRESEARRVKLLKPEARIDLHGLTQEEAQASLEAFLEASARAGLEKVLVITGKGLHSEGEPILGKAARRVIEASPWAGRFGAAAAADGGSGALWVILKARNHFSR
jgi:DNA-nicking Smr family endonuclease